MSRSLYNKAQVEAQVLELEEKSTHTQKRLEAFIKVKGGSSSSGSKSHTTKDHVVLKV